MAGQLTYAPGLTLGEARARLFAHGGLGEDGGYGDAWDDSLLGRSVGELRRRLWLDKEEVEVTRDDKVSFALWAAVSAAAYVAAGALMLAPALAVAAAVWFYLAR